MDSFTDFIMKGIKKSAVAYLAIERSTRPWRRKQHNKLALAPVLVAPPPKRVPLNAVNGPVLVHYLVVLTGLRTS